MTIKFELSQSENLETILFETLEDDLWRVFKNTIIEQLIMLMQKLKNYFAKIFAQGFYVEHKCQLFFPLLNKMQLS